jgi:hypothetical protein
MSSTAKLRLPGRPRILATLPGERLDMERTEVKKAGFLGGGRRGEEREGGEGGGRGERERERGGGCTCVRVRAVCLACPLLPNANYKQPQAAVCSHTGQAPARAGCRKVLLAYQYCITGAASHWNRIAYWRHKVSAPCTPFFLATPHSGLRTPCVAKKSSAHGGEPKTPRIWAFLAKPFRTAF